MDTFFCPIGVRIREVPLYTLYRVELYYTSHTRVTNYFLCCELYKRGFLAGC